jgi:hypothetical protein
MPAIRENWAELLEPGIREWFQVGREEMRDMIPVLYSVQTSNKN